MQIEKLKPYVKQINVRSYSKSLNYILVKWKSSGPLVDHGLLAIWVQTFLVETDFVLLFMSPLVLDFECGGHFHYKFS